MMQRSASQAEDKEVAVMVGELAEEWAAFSRRHEATGIIERSLICHAIM
jgi:hypothetical protein